LFRALQFGIGTSQFVAPARLGNDRAPAHSNRVVESGHVRKHQELRGVAHNSIDHRLSVFLMKSDPGVVFKKWRILVNTAWVKLDILKAMNQKCPILRTSNSTFRLLVGDINFGTRQESGLAHRLFHHHKEFLMLIQFCKGWTLGLRSTADLAAAWVPSTQTSEGAA
jgi:hypothetical protein